MRLRAALKRQVKIKKKKEAFVSRGVKERKESRSIEEFYAAVLDKRKQKARKLRIVQKSVLCPQTIEMTS